MGGKREEVEIFNKQTNRLEGKILLVSDNPYVPVLWC